VGKPSLNAAQPYAKAEGRVFLLVPAYLGCPRTKAVIRLLFLVKLFNISCIIAIGAVIAVRYFTHRMLHWN